MKKRALLNLFLGAWVLIHLFLLSYNNFGIVRQTRVKAQESYPFDGGDFYENDGFGSVNNRGSYSEIHYQIDLQSEFYPIRNSNLEFLNISYYDFTEFIVYALVPLFLVFGLRYYKNVKD